MPRLHVSPALRRLAALSDLGLGLAFTVAIFPAVALDEWADTHEPLTRLHQPAAVLALVAVSALMAVVAFYREDGPVLSGFLVGATMAIGYGLARAATTIIVTGSVGAAIFLFSTDLLLGALQLVVLVPMMTGAILLGRRFRRYLAPDTVVQDTNTQSGGGE
jgi:hypothetical protein